jgi:hypothetical protein
MFKKISIALGLVILTMGCVSLVGWLCSAASWVLNILGIFTIVGYSKLIDYLIRKHFNKESNE